MFDAISRLNPELPGLVAFDSTACELSYGDIDIATHQLTQSGIAPRLRTGVHCHDKQLHIIAVLTLSRIGDATLAFARDGDFGSPSIDVVGDGDRTKTIVLEASKCANMEHAHADRAANMNWQFDGIAFEGDVLRARIAQRATAKGERFRDGWFHSALAGSFARDGALILS